MNAHTFPGDLPSAARTFDDFLRIGMGYFRAGLAEAERINDQKAAREFRRIIDGIEDDSADLRNMIEEANVPYGYDWACDRADDLRKERLA